MNIDPESFWNMTMRQFRLKQIGYLEAQEEQRIHDWEIARWSAVFVIQPHLKRGKTLRPKDLLELPNDKKTQQKIDADLKRKKALFAAKKYEFLEKQNNKKDEKS